MASASVPVPKLPHIASADRDSNLDLSYDKDDESRRTHRSAAIATAPDTQTTKAEAPTTTVTNKTEEQFDDDGNPVRVANLEFFEGILGKGAYGTVRLARRRPVPVPPSPPPSEHGDIAAVPPPSNHRHDQIHHRARRGRRSNRNGTDYFRSSSAPVKSAFFNGNEAKPAPGSDSMTRRRSSYNLLTDDDEDDEESATQIRFALPPNLVQRASSTFSSLFDEDRHHRHSQGDCELVAVKICSKSILKRMRTMERDNVTHKMKVRTALEKVEREIALMKKMRHPNLVTLFEVIDSPSTNMLYMVLEYMPLGEILTYQNDGTFRRQPKKAGESKLAGVNKFGYFDEAHAALYFVDILHALAYLHQHHICHRDLKPENILLDARGIVKISDFGVSHFFEKEHGIGARRVDSTPASSSDGNSSNDNSHHDDESQQQLDSKELCFKQVSRLTRRNTDTALRMTGMHNAGLLTKTEGTWCFWSPEMCQSGTSTFSGYAADLWAAGVCLYIFVTGKLPFYSEVPTDLFDMIAEAKVRYEGLGLSNSLLDLLKTTLEKDPARRAGVGDCLKHKFLQVAREKRIRQLSAELERSGKRQLVVGEDDMRRAFRIVNIPNPALLLRTAQKQIKETYYAARDRMSSLYSQSSQSSVDGADEGVLHNSSRTFSRRHSTTSSSSSVASDNAMNPEPVLPRKLFTIPHDRKITDSTEAASASMSVDSTPMSTDGKKKEEMESATALRKVSKIPQTSGSSTFTKKSKANKTVNAKKTKRRKGGCVVQ